LWDRAGGTALVYAAVEGHETVVRAAVRYGGITRKGWARWTPLFTAASGGHEVVVRLLLGKGAGINERMGAGETALQVTVVGEGECGGS
jgi:hypothetical protein